MMRQDPNNQSMMQAMLLGDEDARLAQQEAELEQQQLEVRRKREQLAQLKSTSNNNNHKQHNPTITLSSHTNHRVPFPSASWAVRNSSGQSGLQPHQSAALSAPRLATHLAPAQTTQQQGQYMKRIKTCHPLQHAIPLSGADMARSKTTSAAAMSACPFTPPSGSVSVRPIPATTQASLSLDGLAPGGTTSHQQQQQQQQLQQLSANHHNNNNFLAQSMRPHTLGTSPQQPNSSSGMPPPPMLDDSTIMTHSATIEDPEMYLQRHGALEDIPKSYFPIGLSTMDSSSCTMQPPPTTPSMSFSSSDLSHIQFGSFFSGAASSDTSMTRTNSSVTGPFQMLRGGSTSSVSDVLSSPGDEIFHHGSNSTSSQQFPVGGSKKRGAPHDEQQQLFGTSPPSNYGFAGQQQAMFNMSRSTSIDSRLSMGHAQQQQPMQHVSEAMSRQASMHAPPMMQHNQHHQQQQEMGISSETSPSSFSSVSPHSSSLTPDALATYGEPMLRTESASSIKSTQSQRARAKDSLQRQVAAANSSQRLLPKLDKTDPDEEAQQPSSNNSKADAGAKVPMAKTTYQRPKRPKIYCSKCDEQSDGFRGEHELRRHDDLKHSTMKTVWVCVDPGAASDLKPFTPIDQCKNCRDRKEYGVYYNAAAHMRRAHFTKKTPRASRKTDNNNNNETDDDKKGGRTSESWPVMTELKKHWMKAIKVSADKVINDEEDATVEGKEGNAATAIGDATAQASELLDDSAAFNHINTDMSASTRFNDSMAFAVGSNTNLQVDLQVDTNDIFGDNFGDFTNYTVQPTNTTQFDAGLAAPASTGSASFNYPFTVTAPAGYPHIDLNVFQGSQISASSATDPSSLAPFGTASFVAQDTQQQSSQPSPMDSNHTGDHVVFGDFDFNNMGSGC